jgi:hypothetical protein
VEKRDDSSTEGMLAAMQAMIGGGEHDEDVEEVDEAQRERAAFHQLLGTSARVSSSSILDIIQAAIYE